MKHVRSRSHLLDLCQSALGVGGISGNPPLSWAVGQTENMAQNVANVRMMNIPLVGVVSTRPEKLHSFWNQWNSLAHFSDVCHSQAYQKWNDLGPVSESVGLNFLRFERNWLFSFTKQVQRN